MIRRITFLLAFLVISVAGLMAQSRLLRPEELKTKPVYTDLRKALARPDSVFKLHLTDQKLRTLPKEIGTLKNLQELFLNGNALGYVPEEIGQLTNLQVLNLYKNRIVELPDEIGALKNLKELYLGRNPLMYVPAIIETLPLLERLDVSYTQLPPEERAYLKNTLSQKLILTY
jgi:Leucine-rich repeat (LRR) protein